MKRILNLHFDSVLILPWKTLYDSADGGEMMVFLGFHLETAQIFLVELNLEHQLCDR
jgi:hypothetical protein